VSFYRFVAFRYLIGAVGREKGRRFLRFITLIAIGGVAVGVATLLLALTIVRGFSREIEAKVTGFGAHVQVENIRYAPLQDAQAKTDIIAEMPSVIGVQPVVLEFALLRQSATEIDGMGLWGTNSLPSYVAQAVIDGAAELDSKEGLPRLVVGLTLAEQLDIRVGDSVVVFSTRSATQSGGTLFSTRPRVRQFQVGGVYETSLADFDETYAFTDISVARTLLNYDPDEVTRLDVTLLDPTFAGETAYAIEDTLGVPVLARTIYEVYSGLFAWVRLQRAIIPLVISILTLVAAFNIVGTLLIVVMEKTREIGILSSMGASPQSLKRLYLSLGLMIGAVGTAAGLSLAWGLAMIQQRYEVIPLPAEAYYMTAAPVALDPADFVLVGVVSLLLTTAAAYIPARIAARIDPLKIIRFS